MEPLVSVIIPAYNVEKYIDDCVNSILSQTYSNYEIWICDDCSTDGTREKLHKYESVDNIHILYNEENMLQARSRNRCIEQCNGEYILMQDADDLAEPERIETLMKEFEDGISFVGSGCYCFDEGGTFRHINGRCKYPTQKDLLWGIPFVHASLMFRKECLKKINGYRSGKHTERVEDYDLIMQLYANGFKGKNIDEILYGYRVDKNNYARRTFKSRINECFIRYEGFLANKILFPLGWIYVFKPIPAHIVQLLKNLRKKIYE